ncbi:MAG: hypothetical protein P4L50_15345 [Anaerolineaceae bacterium]|nr:hypothetical protein [Anaerolineaceae bacterium]
MMLDPVHPVIESHYLETEEGLFFAVKGLVHPPELFLACIRYAPDPDGDRGKNGVHYRRMYHFNEQEQLLNSRYPQYLAYEPTIHATLQCVPRRFIRRIFDPRVYLQELSQQSSLDPVEKDALAFSKQLQKISGIPFDCLGISGSLLIGMHTGQSDLDLSIYGKKECLSLHHALKNLPVHSESESISQLDSQGMNNLFTERSGDTQMEYEDFIRSEQNKVNQGRFSERVFFIRFLKEPEETGEAYGDYRYVPLGRAEIEAAVTSDDDTIFTPCSYPLADVHILQGSSANDLRKIVSFRGRFCDQAKAGDLIRAGGTIEQVIHKSGNTWQRLLLGNSVEDSMFLRR